MADHDIAGNATGQADGSISSSSSSGSGWMSVLTAKLAIALGLFCGTMLFAAIPLLLSRRSTGRRNLVRHVLTGLSCLGGGVFLATCFLHLVPEATEKMQDALESAGVKIDFPVPYAVIIGGFLLVLLLEQAIHSCSSLSGIDGHHLHGPPAIADLGPVPVPNYGSICREELDELERQQQPNGEVGVIRVVRPARAAATTVAVAAAAGAAAGAAAVGCSAEVVVANHHQLDDSNSSVVVAAAAAAAAAANNANHANQRSVDSAVANSAAGAACSTDVSRVAGDVPRSAVNHAATVTSVSDGEAAAATAVETLHGDGAARARAGSATAAAAAGDDDDDVLGNAGQATTDIRRDEAEQQTHLHHHDLATTNSGDSHAVGDAAVDAAAVTAAAAGVVDFDAAVTSVNTTTTTTTSTTTTTTANGSNVAVNAADTETVAPSPSSFSTTSSAAVAVSPVHSSSAAAVSPVHSSSSAGFGLSGPYLGPATAIGSDAGAAVTNLANNTVGNGSASTGAGLLEEGLLTVTAYHHHNHHHHHHNHDHDHHDHRHHHHPSNNSKDSMSKLGVDTPALDVTQSDSEDDDHFASVSTHGDPGSHSAFRAIVLVFALSLHSIFEGIAIGLQPSSQEVFQLFGAIVVHKCVIAVTLSTNLVSASTRLGYCAIFTCVTIFSAMAPLGIAIAIGLNSAPPMVNGVLQCIAAGTFVYITFFEILPHELNSRHTEGTRLYRILMLLAGIGLIIGIMLAFPDKD